jgi:endogenous inhibitor of DNA gyrase (YacG/DUF329 family)
MDGERRPSSFPFCSARCRDRDFGTWIAGGYAVAGLELGAEPAAGEDQPLGRRFDRDRP